MRIIIIITTIILAGVIGCSSTKTNASPDGGGTTSGTTDAGPAGSTALSCLGVLRCVAACPETNADACVNGCVDQARPASQPVTTALKTCIETNQCADAACLEGPCGTQFSACVNDDAADQQGTPSSTPATNGSVPAGLVGTWGSIGLSTQTTFDFAADGQTTQIFNSGTDYLCETGIAIATSGVTTVSGDTLVYHRQQGNQVTKSCGTSKGKPLEPADLTYRYALGTTSDGKPELSLSYVAADGTVASSPLVLHH